MANEKVLIVEDEVILLEILKIRLEKENFSIVTAESAKDGIIKAMAEKPDLLLVDIMMPEMDGVEMIKIIHSTSDFKHVPIIVISALGRESDIKRAMDAGAEDYIVKPYTFDDLIKRMRKLLK